MAQDSLNKITTVIAARYNREQDEPFKRSLEVNIKAWRSTLIARSLEKHPSQRKFFTQTLWVPMECHTRVPCLNPGNPCNVMRSKKPIPQPMRFGNTLFDYVGSIDGNNPFSYAAAGQTDLNRYSKYLSEEVQYEYENNYVLLTRDEKEINIAMIKVEAVFDDPADIFNYNCNDGQCDYWDEPYPVSGDIRQMIIQYITSVDLTGQKPALPNPPEIEVDPVNPKNP